MQTFHLRLRPLACESPWVTVTRCRNEAAGSAGPRFYFDILSTVRDVCLFFFHSPSFAPRITDLLLSPQV